MTNGGSPTALREVVEQLVTVTRTAQKENIVTVVSAHLTRTGATEHQQKTHVTPTMKTNAMQYQIVLGMDIVTEHRTHVMLWPLTGQVTLN